MKYFNFTRQNLPKPSPTSKNEKHSKILKIKT